MQTASLEHVNVTVSDPRRLAALLEKLCNWHIRWEGEAMDNGYTIHIGTDAAYLALYTNDAAKGGAGKGAPLNHVALKLPDLEAAERIVTEAGLKPFNHRSYDPGPDSFYFLDWDGIEFEIVSYR